MTLKEFKQRVNSIPEIHDDNAVVVVDKIQEGFGGLRTTKVDGIYVGFDWNSGQILIFMK